MPNYGLDMHLILSGKFSLILYNEMNTKNPTLCKLSTSIQPFLGRPLYLTSRTLNLAYFIKTSLNYFLRPRSLKFYFSPNIVYIRVVHFMNYSRITHLWAHRVISLINVRRWPSGLNSLILSNQRLTICRSILPCRWSWFSSLMSSINRVTHYLRINRQFLGEESRESNSQDPVVLTIRFELTSVASRFDGFSKAHIVCAQTSDTNRVEGVKTWFPFGVSFIVVSTRSSYPWLPCQYRQSPFFVRPLCKSSRPSGCICVAELPKQTINDLSEKRPKIIKQTAWASGCGGALGRIHPEFTWT